MTIKVVLKHYKAPPYHPAYSISILRTVFKKSESKIFNLLIIKGFIVFAQKYKTLHKQLFTKTVRNVVYLKHASYFHY